MKRHWVKIVVIVSCFAVTLWIFPFLRYEILTKQYGEEFIGEHQQTKILDKIDDFRVIRYQNKEAAIYYVGEDRNAGLLCTYKKAPSNNWELIDWDYVWSESENVRGILWPYFWE